MGLTYQMKMKIPFDMADMNGHIKLPDVILLSLQVSGMQSIELGVSDKTILEDYNLVWIITDYDIEVVRLPRFAEEITIETEALSYNRLFCYRRFTIYDEAGQELIHMIATFVLMDRDSRKVHTVEPEIVAPYQSDFDKKLIRGPKYNSLEEPISKDYHVRFYDLDMNGHIKLPDVILLSLQVSGMQSIELGVSDKAILENYNLVWIITDYDIEVARLPRFAEEITIETEALSYNRLFCYRRFTIYDEAGQELIHMMATFVLMDRDSRKVHAVEPEIVAPYQSDFDKKLIRGPKYESLNEPVSKDYHVRFYDLDMNGHVNNSKYLDWIFEVMGADFLTQYIPKRINLKYVKEVRPGGVITSAVERTGLGSKHEITSDGATNAQAIITWQEIKKD